MKKIIISFAAIVVFLVGASDVFACSCVPESKQSTGKKVQASYKRAAAVFYGEVVEVNNKSGAGAMVNPLNQESVTVKFKVERLWKGKVTNEVIIYTASNSAACGFNFEVGTKYMVYAYDNDGNLRATICSRTAAGNADARYLNKLKKPKLFSKK